MIQDYIIQVHMHIYAYHVIIICIIIYKAISNSVTVDVPLQKMTSSHWQAHCQPYDFHK